MDVLPPTAALAACICSLISINPCISDPSLSPLLIVLQGYDVTTAGDFAARVASAVIARHGAQVGAGTAAHAGSSGVSPPNLAHSSGGRTNMCSEFWQPVFVSHAFSVSLL